MKFKIFSILFAALMLGSCEDFLTRDPMDTVTDIPEFWNNEENIRTSVYAFYDVYFEGYRQGWERADWYSETDIADWTDDNAQETATVFTKVAPASETDNVKTKNDERTWTFSYVRKFNLMINRIQSSSLTAEAKNHWLGVARFLRGMEYAKLVSRFGDVPWYSETLENTDYESLYKPRDKRTLVMDNVAEDLDFACKNIRISDGTAGLSINRDVAYAYTSRIMLFEGTWQKYRENNAEYAKKYLQIAKDAANQIISENKYQISSDYKALTTSEDLANNSEIIIYRSYVAGVVTHSLMAFQNTEVEINSPSKDLVDSYLTTKGLPIYQDGSNFEGDKELTKEFKNRDPRLSATVDTEKLRLNGVDKVYATSGYFGIRFVNESLLDKDGGKSSTCITDAPVMKLNEVMMNYIEAAVELSQLGAYTLVQEDFNKTINAIRDRESTKMPHVTLVGTSDLAVNGTTINDPLRDADVPSIVWEVRRERRTELTYEGIRFNDLRRWSKLQYADMKLNKKLNLGAWLDKDAYIAWYNATCKPEKPITLETLKSIHLDRSGNAGYILPIADPTMLRTYSEKDYLYPIPVDQITLYESKGKKLEQNPHWNK